MPYLDKFNKKHTVFFDEFVIKGATMLEGEKSEMVKCPGVIGWKDNARPPGWTVWENAPLLPGVGGGMGTAGID